MTREPDSLPTRFVWLHKGVWAVLTSLFQVSQKPPMLPAVGNHEPLSIRPAASFLRYLKVLFAIGALAPLVAGTAAIVALNVAVPQIGAFVSLPILIVVVIFLMASWVAIHLQVETQWYVLSDRSVRIRRGIWVVHETTITFENIQDITIRQGPLQRYFGIADILLETAGGGAPRGKDGQHIGANTGFLQGLANASDLKELIAARVRASRSAGLGDELAHLSSDSAMGPAHAAVLREVLAELQATHVT